jgi:alpha-galactosidase
MTKKTDTPPLGWNSYDSYGIFANEKVLNENLDAFVEKLAPHGYKYFVLDAGWYHDFTIDEKTGFPFDTSTPSKTYLDEHGVLVPSPKLFPSGIKTLTDRIHAHGLKFGIHIMRGIPRKAVELNLPIAGTEYTARDIANPADVCTWCKLMVGIDMSKPGAQEYYDSVIQSFADLGVDFIKADDITQFPAEINALVNAIERIKPEMMLSLSPGDQATRQNLDCYRQADMVRLTGDVWDRRNDLGKCFDRWELFENEGRPGCWLDLDMIPFGELSSYAPVEAEGDPRKEERYSGVGWKRQSELTPAQKRTFMAMRALSASPLFMGGELTRTPAEDFALLTHPGMLECNQNGIIGKLIYSQRNLDIRKTPQCNDPAHGWIGIFNRHESPTALNLSAEDLQLDAGTPLHDIWNDCQAELSQILEPDDVLFLKY